MAQPTLVLDLDGTLADTQLDLIPVLNRTTATKGLEPIQMSEVGYIVGQGAKAMIERAFERHNHPLPKGDLEELYHQFMEDYSENNTNHTKVFDGVFESLDRFKESGWLLSVCTNKREDMAHQVVNGLGLDHYMSALTGGNTFDVCKPNAFHLTETVKQAGGNLETAIMVGDSITDISAARNALVPIVAVDFGYSNKPVVEYDPDIVISHFDQLYDAANRLLDTKKDP